MSSNIDTVGPGASGACWNFLVDGCFFKNPVWKGILHTCTHVSSQKYFIHTLLLHKKWLFSLLLLSAHCSSAVASNPLCNTKKHKSMEVHDWLRHRVGFLLFGLDAKAEEQSADNIEEIDCV